MKLTDKQWHFINEVSLKIHATDDVTEMRRYFLSVLSALMEFDGATFYIKEGENPYGSPLCVNFSEEDIERYINCFAEDDPMKPLLDMVSDSDAVLRACDYMIINDMEETGYYKKVLEPKGIRYTLLMPLMVNGVWLGSVNLFRAKDKNDFTDDEVYLCNILRQHLQIRLWRERYSVAVDAEKRGVVKDVKNTEEQPEELSSLTEREWDVVRLWVTGLTDAQICEELFISKNTLKKHISNIFRKLDISSRVELLRIMGKHDIIRK